MLKNKELKTLPAFVFGSFTQRFLAYLIDILLINAVSSFFLNIYKLFELYNRGGSFSLFNITPLFIYFGYFVLLTKFNQGQTIGKMILGLRVVSLYREDLSWSDVFHRELIGRYIQKQIKILYLLLFLTERKQTMADVFADTVIISEKKYLDLKDYLAIE